MSEIQRVAPPRQNWPWLKRSTKPEEIIGKLREVEIVLAQGRRQPNRPSSSQLARAVEASIDQLESTVPAK